MGRILFILFLLSYPFLLKTQDIIWQRSLGGSNLDAGVAFYPLPDGGYLVGGGSSSKDGDIYSNNGSWDFWVMEIGDEGEMEWMRNFGGKEYDEVDAVCRSPDGQPVLVGHSTSKKWDFPKNHGGSDTWFIKLDSSHQISHKQHFGTATNDHIHSLLPLPKEAYLLAGRAGDHGQKVEGGHGRKDGWVMKLDSSGKAVWSHYLGGKNNDKFTMARMARDGGFILVGKSENKDNDRAWIIELTSSGKVEWERYHDEGKQREIAEAVLPLPNNEYLVTVASHSVDSNSGVDQQILLLNAKGRILEKKTYKGLLWSETVDIAEAPSGGYLLLGEGSRNGGELYGNGVQELLLIKVGENLDIRWKKKFGGNSRDSPYDLIVQEERATILGGSHSSDGDLRSNKGESDLWIFETSLP